MTTRATAWSVTINMKNVKQSTADECIAQARQKGWKVNGQLEQGDEGTKHYQLLVKTPQTRFSAIKKMFPTAHIEVARNVDALEQYVTKEETRIGDLPQEDDKYPSLGKIWINIFHKMVEDGYFELKGDSYEAHWRGWASALTLDYFDQCINAMIQDGYSVETMGVNPQIRSAWKNYGQSIVLRELKAQNVKMSHVDRQTDRQVEFKCDTIDIPTTEDADDHEGEQQDSEGSLGEEHDDSEDSCEGEGTDDETEGSGESTCSGTSGD